MSWKKPYTIVMASEYDMHRDFVEKVSHRMQQGWQPQGGPIQIPNNRGKEVLAQAMVYIGTPEDTEKRIEKLL